MLDRQFIYFPERGLNRTPEQVGLDYEDVSFFTSDGLKLHGWMVAGREDVNILWFHGNAGNISHRLENLVLLHKEVGASVFLFDYRGYGLSDGSPTEDNLHSDANNIFSYIKRYLDENGFNNKLIVMGRSLGSASACEILLNHEQDIDGCIIESGFGTEVPLLRILDLLPEDVEYDSTQGFENLKKIINYSKSLLIIHADMDDIIPINEARMLHRKTKSKLKELWIVPNANHNNILMHAGKEYFKRIKKFIDAI